MKLSGPKQSPSQPAAIHVTNIALPGLVQAGLGQTAKRLSRWHVIENACGESAAAPQNCSQMI